MTIYTRNQSGTGVTPKGAPLTQVEVDENWIQLVASDASKLPLTGGTITGNLLVNGNFDVNSTSGASFDFNSSFAGPFTNVLRLNSTAGNNSSAFVAQPSGTGIAGYFAYDNAASQIGWTHWQSSAGFVLGNGGVDAFTINPANSIFSWLGGTSTCNFEFNTSDAYYFKIDFYGSPSTSLLLDTNKTTMQVSGDTYTELLTSNGGYETHYRVSSAGYHYTDGPGYEGILQRAHFARTMLSTTSAGTATLIGGIPLVSASVKSATGTYDYTLQSDVVAPYDEAKKCIAGNFVVTGSVAGTARTLTVAYTGDHTFTVTTYDSANALADSSHRLVIFW